MLSYTATLKNFLAKFYDFIYKLKNRSTRL